MYSPHFMSKKLHFSLVFFANRVTMKSTTKPVVPSPLGKFTEGAFCCFRNFEKRCLFAEGGSPFSVRFPSRDLFRGGGSLALTAVSLVVTGVTQAFKVLYVQSFRPILLYFHDMMHHVSRSEAMIFQTMLTEIIVSYQSKLSCSFPFS
ncbi:hypothetical protein BKP66_00810 [Bacillus amyloliquefaciens]|uniref:Uncharacterized protein n=1 Tax=Bacillus amyloliquefaciens TaxID=1390 RepID=A0AAP7TC82_BACAM|nr:hypothetical protein BKP66_00810 [Bacillus amyloliquefaciens]